MTQPPKQTQALIILVTRPSVKQFFYTMDGAEAESLGCIGQNVLNS